MKIVSVRVEIKQGLPQYSSRVADVAAVADENESLDIVKTVRGLSEEIKSAWSLNHTPEPATITVGAKETPAPAQVAPVKAAPAPAKNNVVEIPTQKRVPAKTSNPLDED